MDGVAGVCNAPSIDGALQPLLVMEGVTRHFRGRRRGLMGARNTVHAVDGIDLEIRRGETFGLVGESGCGKSTVGRLITRILQPTAGRIVFENGHLNGDENANERRRRIQMVFQDTLGALNPRLTVGRQLREPLDIHDIGPAEGRADAVIAMMRRVGLSGELVARYPHELSGGQRQRIVIARVLLVEPSLVVCDEAVSALDVSVQAQVVNFLSDLQQSLGLTYLFISHDLRVVRQLCHRVGVMYLGRLVEQAPRRALFETPQHPYTRALIDAVPAVDPDKRRRRQTIVGDPPSPLAPPPGCHFHTRCPFAVDRCRNEVPRPQEVGRDHLVACHRVGNLTLAA